MNLNTKPSGIALNHPVCPMRWGQSPLTDEGLAEILTHGNGSCWKQGSTAYTRGRRQNRPVEPRGQGGTCSSRHTPLEARKRRPKRGRLEEPVAGVQAAATTRPERSGQQEGEAVSHTPWISRNVVAAHMQLWPHAAWAPIASGSCDARARP